MSKKAEAIKPCPFCGEIPDIGPVDPKTQGDAWTIIACSNATCGVKPSVSIYVDRGHRQKVIRRWNFRPLADRKEPTS